MARATSSPRINLHATAIVIDGVAVLLTGASGSGKSDLALRCIGLSPGPFVASAPRLLADDRVLLSPDAGRLLATCPPALSGLLEVRGIGIVTVEPTVPCAQVRLIIELVEPNQIDRLPDNLDPAVICGIQIPRWRLTPFEPSAPLKLLLALRSTLGIGPGRETVAPPVRRPL